MSRATFNSVFIVAGDSAVVSSAHASPMLTVTLVATAATGTAVAAPLRKTRRLCLLRRSTSLMACPPSNLLIWTIVICSAETSAALDHLDLVAIGIADEEEARQRPAVMLEVAERPRCELLALEAGMFGIEVLDQHGEMAVAVAERIRLLAVEIDRQLQLER